MTRIAWRTIDRRTILCTWPVTCALSARETPPPSAVRLPLFEMNCSFIRRLRVHHRVTRRQRNVLRRKYYSLVLSVSAESRDAKNRNLKWILLFARTFVTCNINPIIYIKPLPIWIFLCPCLLNTIVWIDKPNLIEETSFFLIFYRLSDSSISPLKLSLSSRQFVKKKINKTVERNRKHGCIKKMSKSTLGLDLSSLSSTENRHKKYIKTFRTIQKLLGSNEIRFNQFDKCISWKASALHGQEGYINGHNWSINAAFIFFLFMRYFVCKIVACIVLYASHFHARVLRVDCSAFHFDEP